MGQSERLSADLYSMKAFKIVPQTEDTKIEIQGLCFLEKDLL